MPMMDLTFPAGALSAEARRTLGDELTTVLLRAERGRGTRSGRRDGRGAGVSGWQQTACILCECNCGIEVELDDRRLARIRGDKAHPASQGYTCNKAMRLDHYQNGRHRLTTPLR